MLSDYIHVPPWSPPLPEVHGAVLAVTFTPNHGQSGDGIIVSATGATVSAGTVCTITGNGVGGMPISPGSVIAQVFNDPPLKVHGFFRVGNGPAGAGGGPLSVTVTCGADSGSQPFIVDPLLVLSASIALRPAGTSVITFQGFGYPQDSNGACSVTDNGAPMVTAGPPAPTCTVTAGSVSGSFTLTGIPIFSPPSYTITVTANTAATANFFLTGGVNPQRISIDPALTKGLGPTHAPKGYGTAGTGVTITGGGFGANDLCTLSPAPGLVMVSPSCSIDSSGKLTASFAVGLTSTVGGPYTVTVTDTTAAISVSCTGAGCVFGGGPGFTVDPSPTITIAPGSGIGGPGGTGTLVTITQALNQWGSTTSPQVDTGPCSIISNPGPSTLIGGYSFCLIDTSGNLLTLPKALFTVSDSAPGQLYTVTVVGLHGDPAIPAQPFTVNPNIPGGAAGLSPSFGSPPLAGASPPTGTLVTLHGTGFSPLDTGSPQCTISSPDNAGAVQVVFSSPVCTINTSTGQMTAQFTVGTSSTFRVGAYQITITGSSGDPASTSAGAFQVTPRFVMTPNRGVTGTTVAITGSGFKSAGGCTITNTDVPNLLSGPVCNDAVDGTLFASSFVVSAGSASAPHTVTVTTGAASDSEIFTKQTPTLTVTSPSPANGFAPLGALPGTTFIFAGTGFEPGDTLCTFTTLFVPNPIGVQSCTINPSTGVLSGQFVVASGSKFGSPTITATGNSGLPADAASKVVNILPRIVLNPVSAPAGTGVAITGSGFGTAGGCMVDDGVGNSLATVPICAVSGVDWTVAGSFTVGPIPPNGLYTIKVTDTTPTSASAFFTKGAVIVTLHPTITLNPTSGPRGTIVQVSGSGFSTSDICAGSTLTSSPSGLIGSFLCGSMSNGQLAASFTVLNVAPGTYFVTYTGSTGNLATASFTVTAAQIVATLTPSSGPVGIQVTITGSGFATTDTCADFPLAPGHVTSSPPGLITSYTCNAAATVGGSLVASFKVGSVLPGVYIVTVRGGGGGAGDTAQALFTVTINTPTITLSSTATPIATVVTISGGGFNPVDTCSGASITGSTAGLVTGATCSMSSGRIITASFTVGAVATGTYTITVTGSTGDFAQALFTVLPAGSAFISIVPSSALIGATITVTGQIPNTASGSSITGCSISSALAISSSSCSITGTGPLPFTSPFTFTGSFVVGNNNPGPYTITVTLAGGSTPNTVSGTIIVVTPSVTLTPNAGSAGTIVSISGIGYSSTDVSCSVGGSVVTSGACTINSLTGIASGSFVVGNVAPGSYLVSVSGSSGDSAQATFNVLAGPRFTLSPASGTPGTSVTVTGIGFLPADSSCSISGTGVQTPACSIVAGSGSPIGTFLISAVTVGPYTITLSGGGGDSAQAVLTVTQSPPSLTFTESGSGYPNQTIHLVAKGMLVTDTSCGITGTFSPDGTTVVGPSSCSISGGIATGQFTVEAQATDEGVGFYTIIVTGDPGSDSVSAPFTVIPVITLSPSNGVSGTPVAVTGAGFGSGTFSCSLTSAPAGLFAASPTATCKYLVNILPSNGKVAGTFTVHSTAPAGTYVVTATDGLGDAASATFTVGIPTAQVTISPNTITPPASGTVSVGVTGFGFNGGDTGCKVAVASPITAGTCTMSGGNAGVQLNIPSGTPAGLYLVTVTGTTNGDFASNFLAVAAVTTQTSTTVTTTQFTSSTATSTTTTTTQTQTSVSLTTTTPTGVSTIVFPQVTLTTVSGQTTFIFPQGTLTTVSGQTTVTFTSIFTTTVGATTTTVRVTVTSTHTLGMIAQPMNTGSAAYTDGFGLLAMLLVLLPMLLRRLVT